MADEPAGRTSLGVLHEILTNLGDSNTYITVVDALEALLNVLGSGGIGQAVSDWLEAHPEASTTVQNGSITLLKLANDVKAAIDGKAASSDLQALADNLATLAQAVAEKADASDLDNKADIDGYYSQLTAGLAENLIGRGDAVPAEYLYRTAGGTADIEDGIATIDCIKGNTLVWNQMVSTPYSTNAGDVAGVNFTVSSDYVVSGRGVATEGGNFYFNGGLSLVSGHKYLLLGLSKLVNNVTTQRARLYVYSSEQSTLLTQSFEAKPIWLVPSEDYHGVLLYISFTSGADFEVEARPQLFDLTLMFGAGNEPATVEEFEAMFPLPYYPYSAPKLLPVDIRGIETVGFNAYNPSTGEAELLGGHQYQISGTYTQLSYSTGESIALDSDGIFTPSDNGTLTITGGNATDTCVHLVWSGYRNGEYEEHWSAERPIDTSRFFPTGMKKAGDKADALYADHYDTMIGSVDLGTLSWNSTDQAAGTAYRALVSGRASGKYNIKCAQHEVGTSADSLTDGQIIGGMNSTYVYIRMESCANAQALIAAVSGQTLYYELATPTTTEIDPPLNLSYKVSDFGTERIMVDETADAPQTAPVPMEVEYGINAIDTIRRLPTEYQSHKSMGQLTAALESSLGIDITETWDEDDQRYEYEIGSLAVGTDDIEDGAVTPEKADFFHRSSNLANPETAILGYYVNQSNGTLQAGASYAVSDWIEVEPNTSYSISTLFSDNAQFRYALYDDQKSYITGAYVADPIFVTPSNAKYLRVSYWNDGINSTPYQWMVAKGTEKPQFEPYDNTYIPSQYIFGGNSSEIILNLPSKIYALVGYELNIYFENLTENWELYDWDVTCSKGMHLERGYRITPIASEVGSYPLTIKASLSDGIYVSKTATLVVVAANAGSGLSESVMILGDSTTANGVAVTKLNDNFSSDVMGITTIGTCGTAPNMMEGRSGWSFKDYFTKAADSGVQNPWYDPETTTFSAAHYFATTEMEKPDWFFINLGINDVFGLTNDEAVSNQIGKCKDYCDAMIASMNTESPDTKIGVCVTIPPNHSQDAFGKDYKCNQTRDRYKRNNLLYVQALIDEYDGRESEDIYLVPIHTNLDTVYNMGLETMPVNARNTAITYQSQKAGCGVHPDAVGYWQIADVYTAFLKANV